MCRTDGSQHPLWRLIPWLLGVALVFVASAATGQSGGRVNVNASGIRHTATTATGVRTAVTVDAVYTGTINGTRHYQVPAVIPSPRVGQLAKGALKRVLPGVGWYMTAKGIIDGAGWAIDELSKQVTSGSPQETLPPGQMYWKFGSRYFSDAQSVCSVAVAVDPAWAPCTIISISETHAWFKNATGSQNAAIRTFVASPGEIDWSSGNGVQPVTDHQLGELLKQSPQVVNAVLIDPETGAPIMTPELAQALNDLRKSLEAANGLAPAPDLLPTDDVTKTQPKESAWPDFCGWATTVCEWLDWTRSEGEPHKDLPETELQIDPAGWQSGVGGGMCPSPETFTITVVGHQGQGQFDWQPACDFATTFKPWFITMCSIVAVFILAGLRSGAKS